MYLICMNQHHKSISLAACVFLIYKKIMNQLRGVWDQMLKVPKQTNKVKKKKKKKKKNL